MTMSLNDAFVTWYEERDRKLQINEKKGLFQVKSNLQPLKVSSNSSLLRYAVDGGVRAIVDAAFKVGGDQVAFSTDCVMAYTDYSCVKKS